MMTPMERCYTEGQVMDGGAAHTQWVPGLLCDRQIEHLATQHGMLDPFSAVPVREVEDDSGVKRKVISYGLTSCGYDIRVSNEFKVFTNAYGDLVVDPKGMRPEAFVDIVAPMVVIPPNSFVLARSMEKFTMPRDVLGVVLGKSTYARCGIVVNCTPLEPGWIGYLTVEISNTTPLPARIYAFEGIAQVLFLKSSLECRTSYADKNQGREGKYQDQPASIVLPRM